MLYCYRDGGSDILVAGMKGAVHGGHLEIFHSLEKRYYFRIPYRKWTEIFGIAVRKGRLNIVKHLAVNNFFNDWIRSEYIGIANRWDKPEIIKFLQEYKA